MPYLRRAVSRRAVIDLCGVRRSGVRASVGKRMGGRDRGLVRRNGVGSWTRCLRGLADGGWVISSHSVMPSARSLRGGGRRDERGATA